MVGIKKRPLYKLFHFYSHHIQRLAVHRIRLGQHRDPAPHRKQPADVKVFAGLGFDGFVRCNHQQNHINASHSCQHVAHKAFMPGDIHKSQPNDFAIRRRQFKMREADVDGDAASLFFLQAVGIDPSQRLDQRRLAMIDVPRRAHNNGFHNPEIIQVCPQ